MEDGDTGDCIDTDSCTDGNGNDELHGTGTYRTLARSETLLRPKGTKCGVAIASDE